MMDLSWTGLFCGVMIVLLCVVLVLVVLWSKRSRRRLSDLERDYDDGPRRRDER
jgi:hypothetical protein